MFPLVAVDVGNTRLKFGMFEPPLAQAVPHPQRLLALNLNWSETELESWLPLEPSACHWAIASVNRPACQRLLAWLEKRGPSSVQVLAHSDFPLVVEVPRPEAVGQDRLASAVAANRLRAPGSQAIVLSLGTAVTVDLINAHGAFAGGAILPGVRMAARALHEFTDLLPLVEVTEPPSALGRSTVAAISSGLYWGSVGAVSELVSRLADTASDPLVVMTGGGAPEFVTALSDRLARSTQFVPHLTLAGIALAAAHLASRQAHS